MTELQQIAAALYLAAGVGALLALTLPSERMNRGSAWGLGLGAIAQTFYFATLHRVPDGPNLASLPAAFELTAWMAVLFSLAFMWRIRLPGLAAAVGFLAFLATFVGAFAMGSPGQDAVSASGSIPHAHVLLAAAGLALLGIAALSGLFFLFEHRRLKSKHPTMKRLPLPSLEALDRVNVVALATGFPLLTLGVITGSIWLMREGGGPWRGSVHETWMLVAWAIYGALVAARFAGRQGARHAAASALAGFAFLLFAVVGVGIFR